MLKIIAGVVLLVVIAFIGYRRSFIRLPFGARLIYLTGMEFIAVGFALGEGMIGLLDEGTIRSLTPLFGLGLGLIGLMLGIQLEVTKLRRFPTGWFRITVVQALVTIAVVFLPAWLLLRTVFGRDGNDVLLASFVLSSTAACTAQSGLVLVSREFDLRRSHLMQLMRYVSSIDAAVGLFVFGLAYCLMHSAPALHLGLGIGMPWFVLSLALGAAMGFLLHLLTRIRCGDEELVVFVTGTVLFSAGVASYLRLSPLFVNLVMGAVATNLPGSKMRILNLLARLEQPVYVVFLILCGAIWRPAESWALPLAGVYFGLRLLGKLGGGWVATRTTEPRPPAALGFGLVAQGGVVIAMVMSYYQVSDVAVAGGVVTAVLIAVIASELVGPAMALRLLRRAGEIGR